MDSQSELQTAHRVEVSGWDAAENFFVEKTMMNEHSDEKQEVHLRCALREGCVVFVRLLQSTGDGSNFPVAYRARRVGARGDDGQSPVFLARLHPRPVRDLRRGETEGVLVA